MSQFSRRAVFVLMLICFLIYVPVITFKFITWDDPTHIYSNPMMNPATLSNIGFFWVRDYYNLYIPVTYSVWTVLAMISRGIGLTPSGAQIDPSIFHFANLLFHLANTYLVYLLILSILKRANPEKHEVPVLLQGRLAGLDYEVIGAFFGALFFALHPVQVQAVGWAAGLRDLLSSFLGLLCIRQIFKVPVQKPYVPERSFRKKSKIGLGQKPVGKISERNYRWASVAYALALLSKPSAVALIPMILVLNSWIYRLPLRKLLIRLIPWLILSAIVIIITKAVQPDGEGLELNWTPYHYRPFIALDALTFYLSKLAWPFRMAFDYGRTPVELLKTKTYLLTSALSAALLGAAFLLRSRKPWILGAALLWIAGLSPVLGFIPFDFQKFSTVSDHYLYLPIVALGLGLGFWIHSSRSIHLISILSLLCVGWGIRTEDQLLLWKDSQHMFSHAVDVNPKSFSAHLHLGNSYHSIKQYQNAFAHLRIASEIYDLGYVNMNIGIVLYDAERWSDAITYLKKAVDQDPKDYKSLNLIGHALIKLGQTEEANKFLAKSNAVRAGI
jgi:protein O-mannosyl-transferase